MKYLEPNKKISCDDIIQCIFDLNKLDIDVYNELKKIKESRAQILAKKLNRERSTVYRSLQKLTYSKICTKKTNKIASGGHYYSYVINDTKEIKQNLEKCVEEWYKKMKNTIKEL